jgi:hypothetical protein
MSAMLEVELSVTPASASADTLLDIGGTVRNVGLATVDTQTWASRLLVDGKPSENWAWAIGNGLRDEREFALKPGDLIEFHRSLPASVVLPGPGPHELRLEVSGVLSAPVTVEQQTSS